MGLRACGEREVGGEVRGGQGVARWYRALRSLERL